MRNWRISQRNGEIDLLLNEWQDGNTIIFPPNVTAEDIEEAVADLREQNKADRKGEVPTEYIARRTGLVIRTPRKHRKSPILHVLFEALNDPNQGIYESRVAGGRVSTVFT